jgi:tRNA threonylcarbamoyladenosine biosynthesis protein TsaB
VFIAIDTSGEWCSVAVSSGYHQDPLAKINFSAEQLGQGHSRRVVAMLDDLLMQSNLQIKNAQAIVFANGPGSFTGLRIACGVAQGLAFGQNKPLVAVSTLEVLAQRFATNRALADKSKPTLVLFDARMGELYGQVFAGDFEPATKEPTALLALPKPLTEPFVAKPEAIGEQLNQLGVDRFYAVGNAWGLNLPALDKLTSRAIRVDALAYPRADWLLGIGQRRFAEGKTVSAAQAAPLYVRDNVALDSHEQRLLREKNQLARQSESFAP